MWTEVDGLDMPAGLRPDDYCCYYYVYTPHAGFQHSRANQEVLNYKIPIGGETGLRARPQRAPYKDGAIRSYASSIVDFLSSRHLKADGRALADLGERVGLVPVPPSMAAGEADYDDRNVRACSLVCEETGARLCRDIETVSSLAAAHAGGPRDLGTLLDSLGRVDDGANGCDIVFVVDDVLVTGTHYVACKTLLESTGCSGFIGGLFLARAQYDGA